MDTVANFILVVSGSALGGFIFKLLEKLFDNHLANKGKEKEERKAIKKQVLSLMAQGKSGFWQKEPEDRAILLEVTNNLKMLNEKAGDVFFRLMLNWQLASQLRSNNTYLIDALELEKMMGRNKAIDNLCVQADELYEKLLKMMKNWK